MGKALYKMIGIKNSPPTDLTTNLAKYRDQLVSEKAQTELEKQQKDFANGGLIKWGSKGYQELFNWDKTRQDSTTVPGRLADETSSCGGYFEERLATTGSATYDQRAALLAWFASEELDLDLCWSGQGQTATGSNRSS